MVQRLKGSCSDKCFLGVMDSVTSCSPNASRGPDGGGLVGEQQAKHCKYQFFGLQHAKNIVNSSVLLKWQSQKL